MKITIEKLDRKKGVVLCVSSSATEAGESYTALCLPSTVWCGKCSVFLEEKKLKSLLNCTWPWGRPCVSSIAKQG